VTDVGSVVAFDCNYNERKLLLLLLFFTCTKLSTKQTILSRTKTFILILVFGPGSFRS